MVLASAIVSATFLVPALASATSVTVGNAAINRANIDTFSNFTIIDTNNPLSANGSLSTFSYFATDTNPFEFVLVDSGNVVKYISPTITPPSTGPQTYSATVQAQIGWNLGVHFDQTGTIPFDLMGVPAAYTANQSGLPVVGSTLSVAGTSGRTYSWNATGTTICTPTNFYRDGTNMTAALINPTSPVTGEVNATGCNIGIYFGPGMTGSVAGANIHGANYYGVANNGGSVSVTNNQIHDIGESPLNGDQHGVSIYFANVFTGDSNIDPNTSQSACDPLYTTTGTISGNTLTNYQKGGIVVNCTGATATVSNNTVTGQGSVPYIAQNGIEIARGATGVVSGNNVTGNEYTNFSANPPSGPDPINDVQSVGILLFEGGAGTSISSNTISGNDVGIYNHLINGSGTTTISNNILTGGNRYAGMELDQGNANVSGNAITGSAIGIAGLSFSFDGANPTVANSQAVLTNNTITGATNAGIVLLNGLPNTFFPIIVAHGNNLFGNNIGVQNLLTTLVASSTNATDNWWGSATGPEDTVSGDGSTPDTNPGGTGSPAIGAVNYGPWCSSVSCTTLVFPPPPANACATPTVAPGGYTLQKATGSVTVTLAPQTMFVGTGGNDHVSGGDGNYIICTGTGNATIKLGNGNDTVNTGNGNQTIEVGNGNGYITLGNGNNTVTTGTGNYTVTVAGGNNRITTGSGNQTITIAGNGNNLLTTGSGNDTINLGNGNNTVKTGSGTDAITVGNGNNFINAGGGASTCSVGTGFNSIHNCTI